MSRKEPAGLGVPSRSRSRSEYRLSESKNAKVLYTSARDSLPFSSVFKRGHSIFVSSRASIQVKFDVHRLLALGLKISRPPALWWCGWRLWPRIWDPLAQKLAPVSAVIAEIGARAAVAPSTL